MRVVGYNETGFIGAKLLYTYFGGILPSGHTNWYPSLQTDIDL